MKTPEAGRRKRPRNNNNRNSQKKTSSGNQTTNDTVQLSKALSWLLRHQAIKLGFTMTSGGYVPILEILASSHPRFANRGYTLEDIQRVVETNDKQRFRIESLDASLVYADRDDKEPILCIRATQGHSISSKVVDPDLLLTPLGPEQLLEYSMIVHGTYHDKWKLIEQEGLHRMNRTHIHFTTGLPTNDSNVISGMRKSSQVYIFLNVPMCIQDKIPFFRSDNGVVLTAGMDGVLLPKYFSHVTDAQTGELLWKTNRTVQF